MRRRMSSWRAGLLLLSCVLLLASCATPVGVKKVSPSEAYQDVYANPLGAGVLGDGTKLVLNRYFLLERYDRDPAGAIAALHEKALHDDRRDILYALAEASYLYAGRLGKSGKPEEQRLAPDYFLLSAFYAYSFALEERSEPAPNAFDLRFRTGCDLYNFGLWQGLSTGEGGALALEGGTRKLPFGTLSITVDASHLPWGLDQFERFEAADRYAVRGISVRNRTQGVGLPLIALRKGASPTSGGRSVPVTAFLRMGGGVAALTGGTINATLELYSPLDDDSLRLGSRSVPLETDTTTPLAYNLEGSEIWGAGLNTFLGKEFGKLPNGLYMMQPYRPGRIPVVLVHGTASSPVWWTEMVNTLTSDPLIRQRYQFWFFAYTSGKPIVASAADLRDALRDRLALVDPGEKDPALRRMVVVGHSQGGLLTHLTAVDTGDRLLRALTGKGLDAMELSEANKEKVRRLLFVKPLPFVTRVVFLSTPHRGSFRTAWWNRDLARALVRLPATMLESSMNLYSYMTDDVKRVIGGKGVFTSADGMSPENPMLGVLAGIPLAPWVKGNSIIAVLGEGDPKDGNDGVVEYKSAHLDGVESEFVVRGGHSSQRNPVAIDEVRRILVEHLPPSSREIGERK